MLYDDVPKVFSVKCGKQRLAVDHVHGYKKSIVTRQKCARHGTIRTLGWTMKLKMLCQTLTSSTRGDARLDENMQAKRVKRRGCHLPF